MFDTGAGNSRLKGNDQRCRTSSDALPADVRAERICSMRRCLDEFVSTIPEDRISEGPCKKTLFSRSFKRKESLLTEDAVRATSWCRSVDPWDANIWWWIRSHSRTTTFAYFERILLKTWQSFLMMTITKVTDTLACWLILFLYDFLSIDTYSNIVQQ